MQANADTFGGDREAPSSAAARVLSNSAAGGISRAHRLPWLQDDRSGTRREGSAAGDPARDRAGSRAVSRSEVAPAVAQGATMKRVRAVFERDETGAWVVSVPAVRGCHSYGRTLEQARTRIREALRLFDVQRADLAEDIRLPSELLATVRRARRARDRAEVQRTVAHAELRTAAARLERAGLSRRDAGDLLGLSRQRVQQLKAD